MSNHLHRLEVFECYDCV